MSSKFEVLDAKSWKAMIDSLQLLVVHPQLSATHWNHVGRSVITLNVMTECGLIASDKDL